MRSWVGASSSFDWHEKGKGSRAAFARSSSFRHGHRAFFVYGFAKSGRANIRPDELRGFRSLATIMLTMTDAALTAALRNGTIKEIRCDG